MDHLRTMVRRKAFLAVLAALAAFSLIRRAFPGGRRVTIRSSRNSDVDSSNCALLANGTRGFLTYAGASSAEAPPRGVLRKGRQVRARAFHHRRLRRRCKAARAAAAAPAGEADLEYGSDVIS